MSVATGATVDHLVLQIASERRGTRPVEVGAVRVYRCDAPATGAGAA